MGKRHAKEPGTKPLSGTGNQAPGRAKRARTPEARTQARHRGARHPKKSRRVLCEGTAVRYEFIGHHHTQFRIAVLCRVLRVSRSGFYDWRARAAGAPGQSNSPVLADISRMDPVHPEAHRAPTD